jgi:hypothetical protein
MRIERQQTVEGFDRPDDVDEGDAAVNERAMPAAIQRAASNVDAVAGIGRRRMQRQRGECEAGDECGARYP